MHIDAITDNPTQLLNAVNKSFDDGLLKTWKKVFNDKKEPLYTHIPEQWIDKALIKPTALKDRVRFAINWWTNKGEPTTEIKGYYTGRFTEILLVHFRNYFTKLETFT